MALERKDLRLKLDPDIHTGLSLLADITGRDMCSIAEKLIRDYVALRLHEATLISDRAMRLGISGSVRDSAGKIGE